MRSPAYSVTGARNRASARACKVLAGTSSASPGRTPPETGHMSQPQQPDQQTVGDFIAERLTAWGASRVYGYAGDGINGIIGGIQRAGNRPRFVQPAHEELAALMANAHAKYTGEVGVCLGTSGPGAIHLLN